ncbi:MAG: hypothetical protein ACJA1Q_003099 [Pseudohongiellaceae bacterium]|jgi:hypothetical protein
MTTEICAAFSDRELARTIAKERKGTLYIDEREDISKLPFAALICLDTDDLEGLLQHADIAVFLVHRRIIKKHLSDQSVEQRGFLSLHTLVSHPDLTHKQSDDYWRDNHAPLALRIHEAMVYYHQLSILHSFKGPAWDGFAMLGFACVEDLQNNYFNSAAGKEQIFKDVAKFADTRKSPSRRLVAKTWCY